MLDVRDKQGHGPITMIAVRTGEPCSESMSAARVIKRCPDYIANGSCDRSVSQTDRLQDFLDVFATNGVGMC
jgi:hypothetical protein